MYCTFPLCIAAHCRFLFPYQDICVNANFSHLALTGHRAMSHEAPTSTTWITTGGV